MGNSLRNLGFKSLGDYFLLPNIVKKTGQVPLTVAIGFVFGAVAIFAFKEASRQMAETIRERQEISEGKQAGKRTRERKSPLNTRAYALLALLMVLSLVLSLLFAAGL